MVMLWAIDAHAKSKIGHIQVSWTDPKGVKRWESKLSTAPWVSASSHVSVVDVAEIQK